MVELIREVERQNDVIESRGGVARTKKAGEIPSWGRKRRGRYPRSLRRCPAGLCPLSQLLGQPCVPFLAFGGGKLHSQIEEPFFVTLGVALDEPDQLLCRCHGAAPSRPPQ